MGAIGSGEKQEALPWSISLAGAFLGFLLMTVAAPVAIGWLGLRPGLLVAELLLALPALLALAAGGQLLPEALGLHPVSPRIALLSIGLGACLWTASLGLITLQAVVWPPPADYLKEVVQRLHESLRPSGPLDAALSVAAVALAPALCEELVFRGVLLPSIGKVVGPGIAAAASSLLFGIIHLDVYSGGYSLYRVPFAFVVGLSLAALRLRTGSLYPPIAAHATLNTITIATALAVPDPPSALGLPLLLAGAAAALVLARALPRR